MDFVSVLIGVLLAASETSRTDQIDYGIPELRPSKITVHEERKIKRLACATDAVRDVLISNVLYDYASPEHKYATVYCHIRRNDIPYPTRKHVHCERTNKRWRCSGGSVAYVIRVGTSEIDVFPVGSSSPTTAVGLVQYSARAGDFMSHDLRELVRGVCYAGAFDKTGFTVDCNDQVSVSIVWDCTKPKCAYRIWDVRVGQ